MTRKKAKKWITIAVIVVAAIAIINFVLPLFQPPGLPQGFASGNGRTEATEVDITTKFGGRLATVLVKEGENVAANQTLVQFETKELEAQLRRAQAEVRRKKRAAQLPGR